MQALGMKTGVKTGMKIGLLARRSGMTVKTLRYYEDLGLLPAIGRSEGGYRLFAEESLQRLEFIRRLKTLGLSLEEIKGCLAVHDAGELPCGDIQRQLERQIERIDGQIQELRQLRTELQGLLAGWQSHPPKDSDVICPNLHV
ncbi:heavy metal-responsive transcriptional regulator [Synechococcus sp. CCAP 1479/9]|uniref:heavy metal-responsive transcriptional regulator n=1 Tax=Synechococcus sp. CCAP 1479/9 TaxID=1221593 RepID=UPI001C22C7E5|nr:heavy metal-responsive transcriptional regulator [Synechococcus sp. CCAP 1479/9]